MHLSKCRLSHQFDVVARNGVSASLDTDSVAGGLFDLGDDFVVFRESPDVMLAPNLGAVDVDVEDPARAFD